MYKDSVTPYKSRHTSQLTLLELFTITPGLPPINDVPLNHSYHLGELNNGWFISTFFVFPHHQSLLKIRKRN